MINSEDKRLLRLIGITNNQIESGVYAMILEEVGGDRRIPIIIGFPEAQSIECKLQEVHTPRPLTHDMMCQMMDVFGIRLEEVIIHRLPSGVFAAEMKMTGPGISRSIDARSSDAVALAIRLNVPIFTSARLLDEVGVRPDENPGTRRRRMAPAVQQEETTNVRGLNEPDIETLEEDMRNAAANENYELAAQLKKLIDRKKEEEKQRDADTSKAEND